MKYFFKNLSVVLLVTAVAFGMWQWHRAEVNEEILRGLRANTRLEQTQNILWQLDFKDQNVANAFRQAGYDIRQQKPAKQDTVSATQRRGSQ